jgi:hypothetical protein
MIINSSLKSRSFDFENLNFVIAAAQPHVRDENVNPETRLLDSNLIHDTLGYSRPLLRLSRLLLSAPAESRLVGRATALWFWREDAQFC